MFQTQDDDISLDIKHKCEIWSHVLFKVYFKYSSWGAVSDRQAEEQDRRTEGEI